MDHPFRSAPLGGFNKQDVLTFLEDQSQKSAQAQQELQSRLEEAEGRENALRTEGEDLRRQLAEAQRELEELRRERDGLNAKLARAELDMSAGRTQAGQTAQELETARRELEEARRELETARPGARAYAELKERTAGVELEAHRRAQAIQGKAEQDASRLRRQLERWLHEVRGEYGTLCSDVESTVAHAASELSRAGAVLEQLLQFMGSQEEAFDGLEQICDQAAFGRPEIPAPTDES